MFALRRPASVLLAFAAMFALSACATPTPVPPDAVNDPFEDQNRRLHELNKRVDTYAIRPASEVWGALLPPPVRRGAVNFAINLDTPTYVLNDVLQGEPDDAVHNLFRFLINSTLGVAGIFDPAGSMGLEPRKSDFDQTLYVWGAEEGAFVESPLFGPLTARHAYGTAVDIVTNPTRIFLPFNNPWLNSTIIQVLDTRYALSDSIDATLYDSADSYAITRSIYLQRRRAFLAGEDAAEEYFDPYEDLYGE